jgi:hypothetical protein
MHANSSVGTGPGSPHGHLGVSIVPLNEAPQRRRREVTQNRPRSAGLDRRQEAPLACGLRMAYRVDAPMDRVQASVPHSHGDGVTRQPTLAQLIQRNNTPCVACPKRNADVASGAGGLPGSHAFSLNVWWRPFAFAGAQQAWLNHAAVRVSRQHDIVPSARQLCVVPSNSVIAATSSCVARGARAGARSPSVEFVGLRLTNSTLDAKVGGQYDQDRLVRRGARAWDQAGL